MSSGEKLSQFQRIIVPLFSGWWSTWPSL